MFLKRSLVVMVGILLFIGFFLLKYHLASAHLENQFRQEREKFGVEDQVLTAAVTSTAPPSFAPLAPATPPADTSPATTPTPSDSSSASSETTPAPGNAPDTNTIIGPLPPGASAPAPASDQYPVPAPEPPAQAAPAPGPDTNSGPMMPAPSTMVYPRDHRSPLTMAAYHPTQMLLRAVQAEISQTTGADLSPRPAATNVLGPISPSASASSKTNTANPALAKPAAPASTNSLRATPVIARAVSAGGRAIVLGYHQFTGPGIPSKNIYSMSQDVFDSEMKYLHDNGFNVVPLSDVVAFLKHQKDLPPNAVAITIDDGYKSALNYAEPVLKKYGYPWTFFVYPAFITRTEGKGAASWPDLVELGREGIDVECHSMTHPQLTKKIHAFHGSKPRLLTPEEYDQFLTDETLGAKQILERELNKKILYFAYPYGDYNKIVEAKAIAAGFEAIFTVAGNPVHVTTDIHSIGRYIITKPDEPRFVGYLHQGALSLAQVDPEPGAITSNPNPIISAVLGFNGDPASIETEITGFGSVRHDFDPQTSTVRLYLPHPLIQPQVQVGIRAKDAQTGQTMVANWHFNYEASGVAPAIHQPIGLPAVSAATNASPSSAAVPVSTPTFVTKTDPVVRPPSTAVSAPVSSATNTLSTPAPKDSTAP